MRINIAFTSLAGSAFLLGSVAALPAHFGSEQIRLSAFSQDAAIPSLESPNTRHLFSRAGKTFWIERNATDPATGEMGCQKGPETTTSASTWTRSWTTCPVPCKENVLSSSMETFQCDVKDNGLRDGGGFFNVSRIELQNSGSNACLATTHKEIVASPYTTGTEQRMKCNSSCPFDYLAANYKQFKVSETDSTLAYLDGDWGSLDPCERAFGCPLLSSEFFESSESDENGTPFKCLSEEGSNKPLSVLVKRDGSGKIACASRGDGKNCIWMSDSCCKHWAATGKVGAKTPFLSCGKQHKAAWGSPGTGNKAHWCELAKSIL